MAVPKRRHSKSRAAKRRSTWKLSPPGYVSCPQCHEPKLPHRVCGACGTYAGRQVIAVGGEDE